MNEILNGIRIKRDKQKPWMCHLIDDDMGRCFIDNSHPEWIEKILKPAIEKAKHCHVVKQADTPPGLGGTHKGMEVRPLP